MRRRSFLAGAAAAFLTRAAQGDGPVASNSKDRVVQTKTGDFRLVTDRDESVAEFIRRSRVLVGGLPLEGGAHGSLKAVLAARGEPVTVWLHHASPSDDPAPKMAFMTRVRVAPPSPAVGELLGEFKAEGAGRFALILRRDAAGPDLYRAAGYTTRTPVGFFTDRFSGSVEGVAASTLRYAPPAEK